MRDACPGPVAPPRLALVALGALAVSEELADDRLRVNSGHQRRLLDGGFEHQCHLLGRTLLLLLEPLLLGGPLCRCPRILRAVLRLLDRVLDKLLDLGGLVLVLQAKGGVLGRLCQGRMEGLATEQLRSLAAGPDGGQTVATFPTNTKVQCMNAMLRCTGGLSLLPKKAICGASRLKGAQTLTRAACLALSCDFCAFGGMIDQPTGQRGWMER